MDKNQLNALKQGKSPEEKKVIDYFLADGGCMSSVMSDTDYDAMVKSKVNSMNVKSKALQKIGMDEDQLKEIPPVTFSGFEDEVNGKSSYGKLGKDGIFRTSVYSVTYLFFGDSQVFMYSIVFDMTSGTKKESTEEYFYKDITNFSTSTDTMEYQQPASGGCGKGNTVSKRTVEITKFALIVPGDKFYCSTSSVKDVDTSVNAMKQKLREKKG